MRTLKKIPARAFSRVVGVARMEVERVEDGSALILLAEDDEAQREVLVEVLEVEGYRVMAASGPNEVLAGLGKNPALVLLDLVGVASPQVMSALRGVAKRPALVVMSGDGSLPDVAERLGADGYLTKPYDLDDLLARVREALQGRARAPGAS